jgi:hypothetical protein
MVLVIEPRTSHKFDLEKLFRNNLDFRDYLNGLKVYFNFLNYLSLQQA